MSRSIASIITVACVLVAALLIVQLVRMVRRNPGSWKPEQSLIALGLLVTLIVAVVPQLFADDGESSSVTDYRERVSSACSSMRATTNPLMDAMNAGGIDRDALANGFRNQVTAAAGVLDGLWSVTPPVELAGDVAAAHSSADTLFAAVNAHLDQMPSQYPATMTIQDVSAFGGTLDAALRPLGADFEAAMSELAGEACAPPIAASAP
jgi:hypothetical protein